jgi:hypothetical protein
MNEHEEISNKVTEAWLKENSLMNQPEKYYPCCGDPLCHDSIESLQSSLSTERKRREEVEKKLQESENNRHHHMDCINHLCCELKYYGATSEEVIRHALKTIQELEQKVQEMADAIKQGHNWLRAQANAELKITGKSNKEFVEAHNALLKMQEPFLSTAPSNSYVRKEVADKLAEILSYMIAYGVTDRAIKQGMEALEAYRNETK